MGIGMGIMQIPEEQRDNVRKHASTSLEKARDIACELNDTMSTNCARYTGTDPNDIAERVGKAMPEEIVDHCYCYPGQGEDGGSANNNNNLFRTERGGEAGGGGGYRHRVGSAGDNDGHSLSEIRSDGSSPLANAVTGVERGMNRLVGDVFGSENEHHHSPLSQQVNLVGGGGGGGGRGGATGGGVDGTTTTENEDGGRRVACGRKGENNFTK